MSASLVHTADVLKSFDGNLFRLGALFGPQHGYLGQTQDNMIEWTGFEHPQWGIPVYSLYGEHREPTDGMLKGLDALLVDLQDVGARYYTFIWTLYLCMKAAARNK
ncbi:MAG TPA: exo-beta-N-acetylmuramidase NamZ domain-containing protein, partial [Fibrobacteria bacterium]|nr:exo-beta-N-acetylmuramidase NamZ domain-containing protein [Fibrobacteria bacterium]